jgi:hypothetical protein
MAHRSMGLQSDGSARTGNVQSRSLSGGPPRFLAICLLTLSAMACNDRSGPVQPCWMGIDSLFASGIAVADTAGVRRAFSVYVAAVDSTTGNYDDGSTHWVFQRACYDREYEGLRYWKVWHWAEYPDRPEPLLQRTIDVDQNGVVVRVLGCM